MSIAPLKNVNSNCLISGEELQNCARLAQGKRLANFVVEIWRGLFDMHNFILSLCKCVGKVINKHRNSTHS